MQNLTFLSAVCGLLGTSLIFFYGLPPKINRDGNINLILEQEDVGEAKKARNYVKASYVGLSLIAVSFLLQLVASLPK
mgnify:CR=1 FL=1